MVDKVLYKTGFVFEYGGLKFKKLDNEFFGMWVCLNSTYVKEGKDEKGKTTYELRPESEKSLWVKNDKGEDTNHLNRYGFKWTDTQVKDYYHL